MVKKGNVMVCVTQQKTCERLIKRGNEFKKLFHAGELFVFHLVLGNHKFLDSEKESNALEYLFSVTKAENGKMVVTRADDVLKSIKEFVKENEICDIILGESCEAQDDYENSFVEILDKMLPNVNIHVVQKELE